MATISSFISKVNKLPSLVNEARDEVRDFSKTGSTSDIKNIVDTSINSIKKLPSENEKLLKGIKDVAQKGFDPFKNLFNKVSVDIQGAKAREMTKSIKKMPVEIENKLKNFSALGQKERLNLMRQIKKQHKQSNVEIQEASVSQPSVDISDAMKQETKELSRFGIQDPDEIKDITLYNLPTSIQAKSKASRLLTEGAELGSRSLVSYGTFGVSNVAESYLINHDSKVNDFSNLDLPSITLPKAIPGIGGAEIGLDDVLLNIGYARGGGLVEAKVAAKAAPAIASIQNPILKGLARFGVWAGGNVAFDFPVGYLEKPQEGMTRMESAAFESVVGLGASGLFNATGKSLEFTKRGLSDFNSGRKYADDVLKNLKETDPVKQAKELMDVVRNEGLSLAEKIGVMSRMEGGFAKVPEFEKFKSQHKNVDVDKSFDVDSYVNEQSKKINIAEKTENGLLKKSVVFYKEIKNKLIDSNSPIEDILYKSQKKYQFSVLPKDDISNQIDRVLRAPILAGQFIKDSGFDKIIREVEDLSKFDQYLIARQSIDLNSKGIETGRNIKADKKLIDSLPELEGYAKKVTEYSHKILDMAQDGGLVSKELVKKLKKIYPNYVPMNRIFSDIEKGEGFITNKQVASLSTQNIIQKIEGSNREVQSPIKSLIDKTNDAFVQIERNKAAKILSSYEDLPGFKGVIKKLEKDQIADHKISYFENGEKKFAQVTKEIEHAAKQMKVEQLGLLGNLVALPARIAKVGITGLNLPFVASNVVRDQLFAAINSQHTLKTSVLNPAVFVKSLYHAAKRGDLYQDMVRAGGGGKSFDMFRNQTASTVKDIRAEKTILSKIKHIVTSPSHLYRAIEDIIGVSEDFTRVQQFEGTRRALLDQGRTRLDADILAAKAARQNTTDFFRRGDFGKALNSAFLYLNASIQGSRAYIRSMKRDPINTTLKTVIAVYLPVATTTAWNLSDPERKKVYEDISEYEKDNNIIIIPPNPTKDDEDRYNVIKIPIQQGINKLAIPVRRAMEQSNDLDPLRFGEVADSLIGAVSPIEVSVEEFDPTRTVTSLLPQAFKPSVEAFTNTNTFTGRDIVPRSLENLPPELQYKSYSSGTARLVGKKFEVSPLKVESFIRSTFGSVGSQVLNGIDRALAGMDIIPKEQIGGEDIADALIRRFARASGGELEQKRVDEIKEVLEGQEAEKFLRKQEAEMLYTELKEKDRNIANQKIRELQKVNPKLVEEISKIGEEQKLGITYEDRLIKQLNIENGARAKFIYNRVKSFETREEKNEYVKDLFNRKIINDRVLLQIKALKSREEKGL